MTLVKQSLDVLFTQGIDTKTDNKLVRGSALLELDNGVFRKTGQISKRNGYDLLSSLDTADATITDTNALLRYKSELLLAANNKLYSYSPDNDTWINKSNFNSNSVNLSNVISNSAEQTAMDACSSGNITLYAWEDTRGGIRYSVQDTNSGAFYANDTVLDASGSTPRCISIGDKLFVLWANSNNLKWMYVPANDPTSTSTGTLQTDVHADNLLDVTKSGSNGYVYYKTTTANQGRIIEFNSQGALVNQQTTSQTIIDTLTIGSYLKEGVTRVYVAYKQTASLVNAAVYSQNLVELQSATAIDSTSSGDIKKITMHRTSSSTNQMTFFYHLTGSSNSNDLIMYNTMDEAGTTGTSTVLIRSVGLASKLFEYNNTLHVAVLHESSLQSTIFLIDVNAQVLAKVSAGNAGTHAGVGSFLPSPIEVSSNKWSFPINIKGTIRSENATLFSRLGISNVQVDFTTNNNYLHAEINNELLIAGGILKQYDGNSVVEQGFHLFPEGAAVSATPTTGGNMSDGTYQYVFLYQWVDTQGNIHRSAPSVALSQTLSGGTSTQEIDFTIPTLRITEKQSPRSDVTLEVFRTEDSGSIFYRVSSITSPTDNDPTADTVAFTDDLADSSITGNEILYTTGDVLDNISAPSCDIVITHENRVFIAGLQDRNEVRYSKIIRDGEGVAFNEALSIPVDPKGVGINQLASMDSNLIIFKREKIYRVTGNGPSDTGAGATFTDPELVTSDVGCIDPRSTVLGPEGLYFKSAKGIYLLNRQLGTQYIGAQVEDFNSNTITSAQLLYDTNEVRFMTEEGTTLVYNYFYKQWSTFSSQESTDSVIWDNTHTYLDTSNSVHKQNSSTYLDNGSAVSMVAGSGWITLSGIQNFQRVYRVMLLGEFKSSHILRVTVYNDYSDVPVQTTTFVPRDILDIGDNYYGDEIYGVISPYGGDSNGVYQFGIHLKKQKCQALRVVIEDIIDNRVDFGTGQSMSLTGLTVQVGVKRGLNKLPSGKSK